MRRQNVTGSPPHPMQPLVWDGDVVRFKQNAIVSHLLDENGTIDLNHLARKEFSEEDWEQFMQIIGYSVSGYNELPHVSNASCEAANEARDALVAKKRESHDGG